jgi:hypothetical protein
MIDCLRNSRDSQETPSTRPSGNLPTRTHILAIRNSPNTRVRLSSTISQHELILAISQHELTFLQSETLQTRRVLSTITEFVEVQRALTVIRKYNIYLSKELTNLTNSMEQRVFVKLILHLANQQIPIFYGTRQNRHRPKSWNILIYCT